MLLRSRKTALLPAAIAVLFALSACSGDGANVENNPTTGVQLDTTAPPPNGGTLVPPPLPQAGNPQAIDSENLGDVESFQAVVDGVGNVTAVWTQWDGARNNLWGNRYDVSNGWEAAQLLESGDESVFPPKIVVDSAGNVTVVWIQEAADFYIAAGNPPEMVNVVRTNLWARRYIIGSGWEMTSDPTPVPKVVALESMDLAAAATEGVEDIGDLQLVVDDNDDVTAVWSQHDGIRYNLYSSRHVAGNWELSPVLLDTEDLGHASSPKIIQNGNRLLVLWLQSDGTRQNLWAKWYSAGWAASNKVDTEDLGDVSVPDAVIDNAGNAMVIWRQYDGMRWNLWSARYAGATWGMVAMLESEDLGDVTFSQTVVESGGNVMVAWTQFNGSVSNVWARRFSAGAWGAEIKVETDDSGNVGSLLLVIDGADAITAAWIQSDGSVDSLWVNRFSSGSWGLASKVEDLDDGDARSPVLTVDSANRVIAVWNQFDGSRYDLWFNLYSAGSWGAAARVGTLDSGSVIDPRFVLDGNDRLIAVWQQSYNSRNHLLVNVYTPGSGWGVVGQIDPDDRDSGFAAALLVDSLNNITVLWQQPVTQFGADDSQVDLWANRF